MHFPFRQLSENIDVFECAFYILLSMSALDKDKPIFSTTKRPLTYIKNGVVDDRECQMMAVRWNTIYFNYKFPQHQQMNAATRARCFTGLLSANTQAYAK